MQRVIEQKQNINATSMSPAYINLTESRQFSKCKSRYQLYSVTIKRQKKIQCFGGTLTLYIYNRHAYTQDHSVLCPQCCLCLWIVHSELPLRFSYTFNYFCFECTYHRTKKDIQYNDEKNKNNIFYKALHRKLRTSINRV